MLLRPFSLVKVIKTFLSLVDVNIITSGTTKNRDYRIVAQENEFVIDRLSGDDLSGFPIERARLRSIWYMLAIASATVVGYGWALQARTVC